MEFVYEYFNSSNYGKRYFKRKKVFEVHYYIQLQNRKDIDRKKNTINSVFFTINLKQS